MRILTMKNQTLRIGINLTLKKGDTPAFQKKKGFYDEINFNLSKFTQEKKKKHDKIKCIDNLEDKIMYYFLVEYLCLTCDKEKIETCCINEPEYRNYSIACKPTHEANILCDEMGKSYLIIYLDKKIHDLD